MSRAILLEGYLLELISSSPNSFSPCIQTQPWLLYQNMQDGSLPFVYLHQQYTTVIYVFSANRQSSKDPKCNLVDYIYSIFITKVRKICIFYRKTPQQCALQV